MTQLLPPKKEVALALLERSNVDVYLDPRAKGVVVPPQFRKEPRLILKIGLNMPVPIPDLRLDDESMSCTLSFNRTKFFCVVPWMSVFAMVGDDGRGMVWPDDVPQELAVRVDNQSSPASARGEDAAPAPSSRGKGKSRIQPDAPREVTASGSAPADRGPKSKRPRKKKEDAAPARPLLVAVPTREPEKSSPRIEKLDDRREASATAAERTADRPPATPRVPAAPARPKRELPPYLRVVK
jgi:stringent starvation protein B